MKKVIITVICIVLLFAPTIVAVSYYLSAQSNPVDYGAINKMEIIDPDGKTTTVEKTGSSTDMVSFFTAINDSAKAASELPAPLVGTSYFKVIYYSYDKSTEYKYYFSTDPGYAYYTDNNNKAYRITTEYAEKFLDTDYALCLYPAASQPELTVSGSNKVEPSNIDWKFLNYNGQYKDAHTNVTDTIPTCDVNGTLRLDFDKQPDYLLLSIVNAKDGTPVYDDLYENLDSSLFANNAVYSVTATAKWYEGTDRGACGEAAFRFVANVLAPAKFYIGNTTIDPGEFFVISAKNIVDPADITFTSEPAINYTPVFFADGDYCHALVPIRMDTEHSDSYKFTLSYKEVTQDINVYVNNKSFYRQTVGYAAATVTTHRSSKSLTDFDSTLAPYFGNRENTLYWLNNGVFSEPVAGRDIRTGFGLYMDITATSETYRHPGVNYVVSINDSAIAAMKGTVVYTGELALSGKTVIIDHGCGLKSLYAHLSNVSVSVGDVVETGQELGKVGTTGFTEGTTLHYGLYVFDIPVCPYSLWDSGVVISSEIK